MVVGSSPVAVTYTGSVENSKNILKRDKEPKGDYRYITGCVLEVNPEGVGW